jgi:hypothetical protein
MATSGRGSGTVGYNVQTAVDIEHHLIVTHELTNVGHDRGQLSPMAKQTKATLEVDELDVVADRGYFSSEEILACEEAGITVTLPKPMTSGGKAKGRFVKADFRYLADEDVYICPAGEQLRYYFTNQENGLTLRRTWTNACRTCEIKADCTTGVQRRITRWEHEHLLEAVQRRLDENPQGHASAARDGRASLWHDQGADGGHSFPDEEAEERAHRDGAERARVQPDQGHEHHRYPPADPSDGGIAPSSRLPATRSKAPHKPISRS